MNLRISPIFSVFILFFTFSCNTKPSGQQNAPLPQTQQNGGQSALSVTSATIKSSEEGTGMEKYATKEAKEPVAFNVGTDKLQSIVNDARLQLSFGTPINFELRNFSTLPSNDIARKYTEISNSDFSVSPIHAFSDNKNSLVVSKISLKKPLSRKEFLDKYEIENKIHFAPATLTVTSFMNKDIPMTQFFIQQDESGIFRIVFPGSEKNTYIQFDYTTRRMSIQMDMEIIEPSIGSIMRYYQAIP